MKSCKKLLSVLLSLCMIMTCVSVSFTAFAAGTATDAQWNALIAALKNENVASATFSVSNNTTTVNDTTGDIAAAAEAYYAVYASVLDSNGNQNSSYRTTTQVNNTIKTQVQNKMGSTDFNAYNCGSVLSALAGNASIDGGNQNGSSLSTKTVTVTVTVTEDAILSYNDVSELSGEISKGATYTYENKSASYSSGSGCNAKTYYYYTSTAKKASNGTYDLSAIVALDNAINNNSQYIGKTKLELVELDPDDLIAAYTELSEAYNDVAGAYSATVIAHFFDVATLETTLEDVTFAATVARYIPVSEEINDLCETDYSAYTTDELETLYSTLTAKYASYTAIDSEVKDFIEENKDFDTAEVEGVIDNIFNTYEQSALTDFKPTVDAEAEKIDGYTVDDITDGDLTSAALNVELGTVNGYITALGTYRAANVSAVFGETWSEDIAAVKAQVNYLIDVADYNNEFASQYAYYVGTVYSAIDLEDTDELLEALKTYDSWYDGLNALVDTIRTELGDDVCDKIIKDLNDEMCAKLDSEYGAVAAAAFTGIETAYELYTQVKALYGDAVTVVSVSSFSKLKAAIENVNSDAYEFLDASANYEIPADVAEKYEALCAMVFDDYNTFVDTAGFDRYQQTEIEEIVRKVTADDLVHDKDYVASDSKIDEIIDLLDRALGSDTLKDLLGLDISEKINPSILEKLYSDKVINTVMQYLYPLIAKEFAKVWADLPSTVEADNPVGSGKIDVALTLYDIEKAMDSINFPIFPSLLAETDAIRENYPQVAEVLKLSTTKAVYHMDTEEMDNPWEDEEICDEDGKLNLVWGIDEAENKEEAFLDAAQAALAGLEPILLALLADKTVDGNHNDNCSDIAKDGGAGHGKVGTGKTSVKILFNISVTVDPINLFLNIEGNPGYNNVIVPIFETLGLDAEYIPDGNTFTSIRQVLKEGLIDPVGKFLEQFASTPVDIVTKALPNLAYALSAERVVPLLGLLKTEITYHADAHYSAVAGLAAGDINEALKDGPIVINVGEMLDLEDLGLDLSSITSLIGLILGEDSGITLPAIDQATLATLGELTWKDTKRNDKSYNYGEDGKAAYIEANQADVLLFVLNYASKIISDEDAFNALLGAFGADREALSDTVRKIINAVAADNENSVAAITELVFPQEYSAAPAMTWREAKATETTETFYTEEGEEYTVTTPLVLYSENWTQEQAVFVSQHLPVFINDLLLLFGVKVDDVAVESLADLVDAYINKLYSAETINKIAAALDGVLSELSISEDLKNFIEEQVGIDFDAWSGYNCGEGQLTQDEFKAALIEVLEPLTPALQFLLADKDITVELTDEDGEFTMVTLPGYDGYSNGIVPLLESLYAEGVLSTDEFIADSENIVANIVNPLFTVIDAVAADPYAAVETLVPQLLYYLASDGLTVAVENILYAANSVLDTIRPIYDVNIYNLVDFDIRFAETDPASALLSFASAAIEESTGISLKLDFTSDELFELLAFGDRVEYTSANGSTAYRIENSDLSDADMLTVILRFFIGQVLYSENAVLIADVANALFDLNDEAYAALSALFYALRYVDSEKATDTTMKVFGYVFYGIDTAVNVVAAGYDFLTYDWATLFNMLTDPDAGIDDTVAALVDAYYATGYKFLHDEYSRQRINDALDNINDGGEAKKRTNNILDFLRDFLDILKRFADVVKDFFRRL